MIFTSYTFILFLAIVFIGFWLARTAARNYVLTAAALVFYGWLDWRLCGLLAVSAGCAYLTGRWACSCPAKRKMALGVSLVVNLGMLVFFKYYNFFATAIAAAFKAIGCEIDAPTLKIILPIGISFYSFMSISYTVDVCRGLVPAETRLAPFFAYMTFFPQLLAGPIGRAKEMLPQFASVRDFDCGLAVDGCRQLLWGAFKKVVIADNCARLTASVALSVDVLDGSVLLLGAFIYAIQIYADFSGYSDIAIGVGKLFGIRLRKNFAFPYFASNIADFWRRWHMSLTTWFRDYVYIPLGGSRCSRVKCIRNTFVVFLLSGLWHGANWTYVIWGFVHACLFLPLLLGSRQGSEKRSAWRAFVGWALTFSAVVVAWVFFSSPDIASALHYLSRMFSKSLFTIPRQYLSMLPWIAVCMGFEWVQRKNDHAMCVDRWPKAVRWCAYFTLAVLIVAYRQREAEFIYFQF